MQPSTKGTRLSLFVRQIEERFRFDSLCEKPTHFRGETQRVVEQVQISQHAHARGLEEKSSSNRFALGRVFENLDLVTSALEKKGRGWAGRSTPDDGDVEF